MSSTKSCHKADLPLSTAYDLLFSVSPPPLVTGISNKKDEAKEENSAHVASHYFKWFYSVIEDKTRLKFKASF